MKKGLFVLLFVFVLSYLTATPEAKVGGDFSSWTYYDMDKSIYNDVDFYYTFHSTSTTDPSTFLFQKKDTGQSWVYWGDEVTTGHYLDSFGTNPSQALIDQYKIDIGGVTSGDTYIFVMGYIDRHYDRLLISSFKIYGGVTGESSWEDATAMTKVESDNGDYWYYSFNATSTGPVGHGFRLLPNGTKQETGGYVTSIWEFGPNSSSVPQEVPLNTQTYATIGSSSTVLYIDVPSTGDYTISVRPSDKVVWVNQGDTPTLPVELSTFSAQYINNTSTLYWRTQSESDNLGWYVYRNQIKDFNTASQISDFISGYGTTTLPHDYIYEDHILDPQQDETYYYWLESVDLGGTIHHYAQVAELMINGNNDPGNGQIPEPTVYGLQQNTPNPFNPDMASTTIQFSLPEESHVELVLYNLKGQKIAALFDGYDDDHAIEWNGKDSADRLVKNGIYLVDPEKVSFHIKEQGMGKHLGWDR
jgi:hypothetical protein